MKKFFYIILPLICMILSLSPINRKVVLVNASVKEEITEVSSSSDLNLINENLSGNFVFSSDVDITVSDSFFVDKFNGIIDGKGHTLTILGENITDSFSFINELSGSISNLKIIYDCDLDLSNESTYFSFIHTITETGKVNSLELESSITTGSKGLISFGAIYNYGQISDCTSQGYISNEDKISTYSLKYGSFSIYNYGRIYDTYNSVNFNVVIYYGKLYLGGITTYNYGEINWCGNKGNINSNIRHHGTYYYDTDIDGYIGGITAYSEDGILNNVFNIGNLSGDAIFGGIIGYVKGNLTLNNSYVFSDIYAIAGPSGGIIGKIDSPKTVSINKAIFKGKISSYLNLGRSINSLSGCIGYVSSNSDSLLSIKNVLVDADFNGDVGNYVSGVANIFNKVNIIEIENCYIDICCNIEIGEWVELSYSGALNAYQLLSYNYGLLKNIYTNSDVSISYSEHTRDSVNYIQNGNLSIENCYSSSTSRYKRGYRMDSSSQYIYNTNGINNLLELANNNLPDFWQIKDDKINLFLFDNGFFERETFYEFGPEIKTMDEIEMYINDELIESSVIYPVGNYDVYIEWGEYIWDRSVSILPTIKNIQDGETYSGSVTPYIKGGTITLDGHPYDGVSQITEPGEHIIKITGVNGYEQNIRFFIGLVDSGIKNDDELILKGSLTFSGGTATLDGRPYISGEIIDEVGNHTIVITGSTGYIKTINFIIKPLIIGVENNSEYSGSVTPNIEGGTITLDGHPYDGISKITEPGEHIIKITGANGYEQNIRFFIGLVDSGIKNDDELILKGSLTFSGGTATLDGKPYTSGQVITEVGHHTIVITGSDGYSKTINFTILPSVEGIEDGGTYSGSVTPNIEGGTITLDDKPYDGTSTITEAGTHVIKITGVNGYNQEINFIIDWISSGVENDSEYYLSTEFYFYSGTATLDGKPYTSGQVIAEVGYHTIVLCGSNGYNKTINFTILPKVSGIQDGQTYSGSVTPNIEGGTITLDGKPYDGTSTITEPGTHVIKITGSNGYEKTNTFTIGLVASGIEDGSSYYGSASYDFSGGTATLDGKPYTSGQVITEVGHHTILITGSTGYSRTIEFTVLPIVTGIQDGQTYSGSVTPNIEGGTITLDGKPYDGTSTITEPGTHVIKITGSNGYEKTITFTIGLVASGIEDGSSYYGSASYDFSGGNATLDGKPYTSGQVITEVGHHTIVITGSDGYSKTISFTILPLVEGIEDGQTYSGSVTPNIEGGTITLDGKPYDGTSTITEPGEHTIKIVGSNGYEQEIKITIDLVTTGIEENDKLTINSSLIFSGGTATLDGKPYTSGQVITEVGHHTIVITGSDGYSKTISFTILPSVEGIEDGQTYSGSVTPNIEGGTITLDGKPYDGTSTITEPGEHTIKIVGSNGYELEIKFTIGLVTSGVEDGAVYYEFVSYDFSGGNATLDGKPYTSGQVITEVGHHTIVVTGANGYSKVINFTIKAIDYTINSNDHSWQISINDIHPNTTVTIDGKEISGSYSEDAIGNHTLIIRNGDYEEVINFTIKENLTFADGDVFTEPLVLDDINGQVYVDGVLVEDGYRIDQNGTHEIRIVGTNGYESIIIIEYRNPNYLNAFMMLIPISIACVGIIYMAIRRRRVI